MKKPSKERFRRILKSTIVRSEPFHSVLDCASAGDKFTGYFLGKDYVGVDIDATLIQNAQKRKHPSAKFYVDNMLNFESEVKSMKFDLIVSTHTLAHFSDETRPTAFKNLMSLAKPGASMIVQLIDSHASVLDAFRANFAEIRKIPYRGAISRFIESNHAPIFRLLVKGLLPVDRFCGTDSGIYHIKLK